MNEPSRMVEETFDKYAYETESLQKEMSEARKA